MSVAHKVLPMVGHNKKLCPRICVYMVVAAIAAQRIWWCVVNESGVRIDG